MAITRNETYWAAESDLKKFGGTLCDKRESYREFCESSGRNRLWLASACAYWGIGTDGSYKSSHHVTFSGDQGEVVGLKANLFRALINQQMTIVTGSRPSFTARPVAYDAQTSELITIGNALCDRILDDHAEEQLSQAALYARLYGEGVIVETWDEHQGKPLAYDEAGQPLRREGAIMIRAFRPDQVVRDTDTDDSAHDWVIVLRQHSRWSLMARFPSHSDAIRKADDPLKSDLFARVWNQAADTESSDSDRVLVAEFYHRKTDALPNGRMTWAVGDTVIADGPMALPDLPVFWMIPSREPTSSLGYGDAWDLLGPQAVYDSIVTQITTTRENFGIRTIYMPEGVGTADPDNLTMGLRIMRGTVAPVVIDLEGNAVQQGQLALDMLRSLMQMQTGLNDAVLGDPGKSASGRALAQMHNMSAQFNGSAQRAYAGLFEQVMSYAIRLTREFATTEQVVHVAGRNRQGLVHRFMGERLQGLDGIKVELGSAAMRTTPMRIEIASDMLAKQVVTPQQYLEIMATGRLEPATEGPRALEVQCERENERLMMGTPVIALITDNHAAHIQSHSIAAYDPQIRDNPEAVEALNAHILSHAQLWTQATSDPMGVALLAATGQQPAPGAQMIQAAQAAEAAAANPAPVPGGAPVGPVAPPNAAPGQAIPVSPTMGAGGPSLPTPPPNASPVMGLT